MDNKNEEYFETKKTTPYQDNQISNNSALPPETTKFVFSAKKIFVLIGIGLGVFTISFVISGYLIYQQMRTTPNVNTLNEGKDKASLQLPEMDNSSEIDNPLSASPQRLLPGVTNLLTMPVNWSEMIPKEVQKEFSNAKHFFFEKQFGKAAVWLAENEKNILLTSDGKSQKIDSLGFMGPKLERTVLFDPTGNPYYLAKIGEMPQIIRNGSPLGSYAFSKGLKFSSNGKTEAYVASNDGQGFFLVVNGERHPETYSSIQEIWISENGSQVAIGVLEGEPLQGGNSYIVWDKFRSPPFPSEEYSGFGRVAFSPDGNQIAYIFNQSDGKTLYINDQIVKKSKSKSIIASPRFTNDSKKLWYVHAVGDADGLKKSYMASSAGDEGKHYDAMAWNWNLAADGTTPVYEAIDESSGQRDHLIVVGNREGKRYSQIDTIFAYQGNELQTPSWLMPSGETFYLATKRKSDKNSTSTRCLVVADKEIDCHKSISREIGVNKDWTSFGYVTAPNRDEAVVVVNGKQDKKYTQASRPNLSPDGKSYTYIGTSETGSQQIIVNDNKLASYISPALSQLRAAYGNAGVNLPAVSSDEIAQPWPPVFSNDGQYIIYAIQKDNLVQRIVELATPSLSSPEK